MSSILSQALRSELDNTPHLKAVFKLGGQSIPVGANPLTAADFQAVNNKLPTSLQNDPTQFFGQIDMLVRKTILLDDEGCLTDEKAFDAKDIPSLKRLKVDLISTMFTDMFGDQISDKVYDENSDGAPKSADEDQIETAKGN